MNSKIKTLVFSAFLSATALVAFSQQQEVEAAQKATCDASNDRRCVITNVGEGTGALIVQQ